MYICLYVCVCFFNKEKEGERKKEKKKDVPHPRRSKLAVRAQQVGESSARVQATRTHTSSDEAAPVAAQGACVRPGYARHRQSRPDVRCRPARAAVIRPERGRAGDDDDDDDDDDDVGWRSGRGGRRASAGRAERDSSTTHALIVEKRHS